MRGTAIAAIGAILVAACGTSLLASAGAAPSPGRSPCDRPFTSTLLQTGKVRIYAQKEHSVNLPGPERPAISGRPIFGCLKSVNVPRLLDLPEADDEEPTIWVSVAPEVLAVRGPLVAYALTQYYFDTHGTWIRVKDLRTGIMVRSCRAGGDIAPGNFPRIKRIVLDAHGDVAWSAEAQPEDAVWACDASGTHQLDHGQGVDLESLTLKVGVLHWLDQEGEHEAGMVQPVT